MGHRGILFTGELQYFGQPLLGDPHWNPLWQVAREFDLPISFHVGSGDMREGLLKNRVSSYGLARAFTALAIDILLQSGRQVSHLIMFGVLNRYPTIKFVSVFEQVAPRRLIGLFRLHEFDHAKKVLGLLMIEGIGGYEQIFLFGVDRHASPLLQIREKSPLPHLSLYQ